VKDKTEADTPMENINGNEDKLRSKLE